MTFWGYLLWAVLGLLALVPILGLGASLLELYKEKIIKDYEKKKHDGSL